MMCIGPTRPLSSRSGTSCGGFADRCAARLPCVGRRRDRQRRSWPPSAGLRERGEAHAVVSRRSASAARNRPRRRNPRHARSRGRRKSVFTSSNWSELLTRTIVVWPSRQSNQAQTGRRSRRCRCDPGRAERDLQRCSTGARRRRGGGRVVRTRVGRGHRESSPTSVLGVLDELVEADVIRPSEAPRRFCFRHPIVRTVVYEEMPSGWRLGAHARAAAALAPDLPRRVRAPCRALGQGRRRGSDRTTRPRCAT